MCICVNASQLFKSTQISFRKLHWLLYINVCSLSNITRLHCCFNFPLLHISPFPSFLNFAEKKRTSEERRESERIGCMAFYSCVHCTHAACTHLSTWSKQHKAYVNGFGRFTWNVHCTQSRLSLLHILSSNPLAALIH